MVMAAMVGYEARCKLILVKEVMEKILFAQMPEATTSQSWVLGVTTGRLMTNSRKGIQILYQRISQISICWCFLVETKRDRAQG